MRMAISIIKRHLPSSAILTYNFEDDCGSKVKLMRIVS